MTTIPVSPSPLLRQRSSRYTIHARRNLPDKELRYLRTVIVTAAVYLSFSSELHPEGLTHSLNFQAPGKRQSVYVALVGFAQTCVFSKQSPEPILCGHLGPMDACSITLPVAILIPKLRNHFAEFLNRGYLDHLRLLASPTCVSFSTGTQCTRPDAFLGSMASAAYGKSLCHHASGYVSSGFA